MEHILALDQVCISNCHWGRRKMTRMIAIEDGVKKCLTARVNSNFEQKSRE